MIHGICLIFTLLPTTSGLSAFQQVTRMGEPSSDTHALISPLRVGLRPGVQ